MFKKILTLTFLLGALNLSAQEEFVPDLDLENAAPIALEIRGSITNTQEGNRVLAEFTLLDDLTDDDLGNLADKRTYKVTKLVVEGQAQNLRNLKAVVDHRDSDRTIPFDITIYEGEVSPENRVVATNGISANVAASDDYRTARYYRVWNHSAPYNQWVDTEAEDSEGTPNHYFNQVFIETDFHYNED